MEDHTEVEEANINIIEKEKVGEVLLL